MIRAMRPEEAPALSALALRSKAHWGYDRDFLARCRQELTVRPDEDAQVLDEDGVVRGFYGLEDGELTFLFVEPAQIGRGFGRALLEHAIERAREQGHTRLMVDGDPHAAAFYRAAGGELIAEVPSASIPGRMLPRFAIPLLRR